MKVIIDINIIIDILERREPFFINSYRVIQLGLEGIIETIISTGNITTVYYIIRKSLHDAVKARENIFLLGNIVRICNSTPEDITQALILFIPDFEDAVIAAIAKREKADYIITRNTDDFANSPVPAVNPEQFLEVLKR